MLPFVAGYVDLPEGVRVFAHIVGGDPKALRFDMPVEVITAVLGADEQGRAFEPGYSTKRRGWGLGLALARRVVEDYHAGRIDVRHSMPGEGTIMVIRFPT